MRSVAVLIAPLLTLLLYSGPALAGQHSSHVVIVNNVARAIFVVPRSRVVIVQRPFIVNRPLFVRPFVDREVLIVRRSSFGSPVIVQRTFVPQRQVFVFDSFEHMN